MTTVGKSIQKVARLEKELAFVKGELADMKSKYTDFNDFRSKYFPNEVAKISQKSLSVDELLFKKC